RLPGPYGYLLSLPQAHLLAELLDQCHRFDTFTYLPGSRASELLTEPAGTGGTRVVGGRAGDRVIRALCAVGADGRDSKVRQLAGVTNHRQDVFDLDVLWFKAADPEGPRPAAQIHVGGGTPVLAYSSWPGSLQVGWTLPHRGFRDLGELTVAQIADQIAAVA